MNWLTCIIYYLDNSEIIDVGLNTLTSFTWLMYVMCEEKKLREARGLFGICYGSV